MKKTRKILCLILALFICAFFPACKGRYDNLKMSFYLNDGTQLNELRLVIDETNENNLASQKIYVQFDGIKEKYIGDVLFYAEPVNRVEISNITSEGNKYFATVNALNQGAGKIYIKHLTTGKTTSINLVVDKKSTTVTKLTNEYFISTPKLDTAFDFDISSLITQNGTDQIGFRLEQNGTLPSGVEFIETDFNEEIVATGLQLSNNISHGATFTVYPVSYMEGYETINEYQTQKIKFTFVKALDEDSFVLDTDTMHQPYINDTFYLIANDTDKAQSIEGVNYKFNDVQFDLKYTENNNTINMRADTGYKYLENFYDVTWNVPDEFESAFEIFYNENDQIVVEAKRYTEQPAEITISLVPKVSGNLAPVSKTVMVKGEVKPKEYEISVQGKIQANVGVKNKYNIDLYDYYRSSDSVYGASFTFNPVAEYSYADLKNVKIKVNPAVLDVKNGTDGTNELETNNITGYSVGSNKYLLQFYLDGKPLKFEMVEETVNNQSKYYAVSEPVNYFDELKRVQIKYTEKAQEDTETLECFVENFYSGEFEYLKSIQPATAEIQFNHKEGITDIFVNAGTLTKNTGYDALTRLADADDAKVKMVYLDRVSTTMNTIFVDKLLGVNNKIISGATINVKVTNNFGATTPLKLKQNMVGVSYTLGEGDTEILYNYNTTGGEDALPNNAIILGLTKDTDVGYYTIEFWYADEQIYSVTCLVYENLVPEQMNVAIDDNKNIIKNASVNEGNKTYKYADYNADYIIKADSQNKIKIKLLLPSQFTVDYIKGYEFALSVYSDDGDTQVNLADYLTEVKDNNQIELVFKKGLVVNGKINYIKLEIFVKTQEFKNIITLGEIKATNKIETNFFVYEEIKAGQISLNKTNVNGYFETTLSAYYKDLSRTSLQVNLTDSKLWDYVQLQDQIIDQYNLGQSLEKLSADAVFDANVEYYDINGNSVTVTDENFDSLKANLYIKTQNAYKAKVVWFTDDTDGLLSTIRQTQTGIELQFNGKQGSVSIDVFAKIKQFDLPEIVLQCHIVITEPIITTNMYITSETKQISGSQAKRVISLQAGQTYKMEVEYYSNKFERLPASERKITNPGFIMLVLDRFGNVHDSVVTVDGDYLKVANNFTLASELHVVVFAKDALKEKLTFRSGYTENELASYFMDGYKTAYISIDLIVSNGDELNPYPVFTEEDFWAIGKDSLSLTKHYVLMNNVYLTYKNNETWFENFSGGLTSYGSDNFTVFGVKLDDSYPYLFKETTGAKLRNVNFDAKINFTSATQEQARGVFGKLDENTELCDVTVNLFGENVNLIGDVNRSTYFGALAGVNKGVIKYENISSIGSKIEILTLSGSNAYFGGLVGQNLGIISGVLKNQNEDNSTAGESKIVFGSYIGNAGALTSVKISAYGFNSGAIGGVVGLNETSGEIKNGYAVGEITEKQNETGISLNNVGGVIGKNIYNETNVTITLSGTYVGTIEFAGNVQLTNLKSAVQISANENVGGITGVDENGIYAYCKYQILANYTYGINANDNVGGIIGNATNSKLEYCSVYSYRCDYNNLAVIGSNSAEADIKSSGSLGGLVGLANSSASTISAGEYNILAIKNSSVNAYVSADIAHALVGKRNARPNAEIDCYFVGKIVTGEGTAVNFKGDINGNPESANVNHSYVKTNEIQFSIGDVSHSSTSRNGWVKDTSYNGGYPYIISNNKPIFEVAPTSINLSLKDNSVYAVKDDLGILVDNLAHIVLYDFNLNVNDVNFVENYQTQTEKNTHDMVGDNGIFNLTVLPNDLLEVRLNAVSSNPSVVMVSNDKLIARGVGQAELTFTSVLNNAVKASYLIDVSKPIGNTVKLYISRDKEYLTPNSTGTINITKDEAILLHYIAEDEWAGFNVATNENTCLQVEVSATKLDGTALTNDEINTYLQISGQGLTNNKIELNYNQPFSIKALKKDESITFTFNVTPYIAILKGASTYKQLGKAIAFDLKTVSGVTGIALSVGDLVLYPNDNTVITAYLTTDRKVQEIEALNLIDHLTINSTVLEAGVKNKDFGEITDYISVLNVGELNNDRQEIEFKLTIPTEIKDKLLENNKNLISIVFKAKDGLGTGVQDSIQLNVIKQRIDELVVRNYIYKRLQNDEFDYTSYEQNNTLRPISEGLMLIDLSPINGYFDYLEISDITGNEEIVFVQTRGIHGTRVDGSLPSSDGKGIRLNRIGSDKTISVATMISSTYSNKSHTVKVSAFVAGEVVKTTTIDIDVKMKPEIAVYLVKPDGMVERDTTGIQYVALGTQTRFKVETNNCDEGVEPTVTAKIEGGTDITLANEGNGYYSISANDIKNTHLGKDLTIEASSYLTLDSNTKEQATTTQKFKVVNYVIDNVSVTHSTTNTVSGRNVTKIYGNLNVNVPIEFYFRSADIEYSEELNEFTQETYYDVTDNTTKQSIHNILTNINTLKYVMFDYSRLKTEANESYAIETETNKIKLTHKKDGIIDTVATLTYVTKTANNKTTNAFTLNLTKELDIDLVLTLPLKLNNNNNFELDDTDGINKIYRFNVDFIEESSFLQPKAVRNEDDFNAMSSGGDYILAKDITLTNYSPLDVKLNSFDGNGHTITIKSFATFAETTINAGLFKQIYENMVVMNLEVKYDLVKPSSLSYYDLCNNSQNVAYTTANFGGITATNYGIISNCKVSGSVQLSASSVEQVSSNDEISFNIGGLVNANETTGRITNSISALKITAKANIAGFAYTNAGKIASSFFDANSGKGMIYAYNSSVTVPYSIKVAGFVLENESSAEISMCYVESGTNSANGSVIGNISAKDYSSGFVYTNAGSIYDCYADIELIGESSNNHITGFVYENTGSVNNCYSYINEGKKTNLISMFAREGTTGINNCYEIKQDTAGYKNNVDGLTTVSILDRMNKNKYPTFMFGNNVSAVWASNGIDLPKLVATTELVTFTGETLSETDKLKDEQGLYPSYYHGLKDLQLVKTETKNDLGVVINVSYSYKVLEKDYGEKQNPILIYNIATWDYYLGQTDETNSFYQNTKYYYRLINDINFETIYNNPTTSVCEFNGNLQGNNMDVENFKIFSSANLSSIGLFASLKSLNNLDLESAIRNLDIIPLSVTATRTQSVGVLAGMAENYNLYNIDIEAENITVVGGNAVGGVVGLVRGKFDIDGITSTVGAYASRSQQGNNYAVYTSNYSMGKMVKDNLANVYYAGGAFAILDASTAILTQPQQIDISLSNTTQMVRHITTSSSTNLFGDTVGGAVGLVGKMVKLEHSSATIDTGKLSGYQLSAGLVGENRGLIENATISISGDDVFKLSTYVSAGAVGFNFNGYINNVSVTAEISKTNQSVVAGVVGRNLNGVVNNVSFDGTISGYYVGGIIGADYTVKTYLDKTEIGGGGAIRLASSELINLTNYTYYSNGSQLPQFSNLKLSANCIENLISKSADYYDYVLTGSEGNVAFRYKKVLGLAIGLTDKDAYNFHYGYDSVNKQFVINSTGDKINIDGVAGFTEDESFVAGQKITLGLINYISSFKLSDGKDVAKTIIMFVVGAKVESLDFWVSGNGYSTEYFAFVPSTQTKFEFRLTADETNIPVYIKKSTSIFIQADKDSYKLDYTNPTGATITADCDSINAMFDDAKYKKHEFTFDDTKNTLTLSLTKNS